MNNQDTCMDLCSSACQEYGLGCIEAGSNAWIQPSCSVASVVPELEHSLDSVLFLPELPLQPSISSELDLLCDVDKGEGSHGIRKAHDAAEETAQNNVTVRGKSCSRDQQAGKLRRTRSSEVHNKSERRRRDRINGHVRALKELMPHCKKKDRASIIEDAEKYIKALKLQIEMMTKTREVECRVPCMSSAGNAGIHFPSQSSFLPIRPGIGMGIGVPFGMGVLCVACNSHCIPINQLPLAAAGFPFLGMCPPAVQPTAGNCSDARPCSEAFSAFLEASTGYLDQPYVPSRAEANYATLASSYPGLETGFTFTEDMEAGRAK